MVLVAIFYAYHLNAHGLVSARAFWPIEDRKSFSHILPSMITLLFVNETVSRTENKTENECILERRRKVECENTKSYKICM